MEPKITSVIRKNLAFESPNLGDARTSESFEAVDASEVESAAIRKIVSKSLELLDSKYWPKEVTVDLESEAEMIFPDGFRELIPISLIVSQQQPSKSSIRMGMWEIKGNFRAFESILAHEMGHMLPEWISRSAGITSINEPFLTHWSKPIYEGIADWTSAAITGRTIIGSEDVWFGRDILKWATLADSQNTIGDMSKLITVALEQNGLLKFRAYREWAELVDRYLGNKPDPYAEGQWIASQLWKESCGQRYAKNVYVAIQNIAESGEELESSEDFLIKIKSYL